MSIELIYTSASRGLNPGTSGFCTVAVTGGTSKQISSKLEMLSGYEFPFNISDSKVKLSPANYSHTRISVGTKTRSVISRIGFSGSDYSGRANKIAHHFLLRPSECLATGPADLQKIIQENAIYKSSWEDDPSELSEKHFDKLTIGSDEKNPRVALNWQGIVGDAGWAGILLKAFVENKKTPAYVIFEAGQDLLPLFAESLSLLPEPERWNVCYSTYYTVLPPGCAYHWRGILTGSSAHKEIARFPNATVIDITKQLPRAEENRYSKAAREGTIVPIKHASPSPEIVDEDTAKQEEKIQIASKRASSKSAISQKRAVDILDLGKDFGTTPYVDLSDKHSDIKRRRLILTAISAMVILVLVIISFVLLLKVPETQNDDVSLKESSEGMDKQEQMQSVSESLVEEAKPDIEEYKTEKGGIKSISINLHENRDALNWEEMEKIQLWSKRGIREVFVLPDSISNSEKIDVLGPPSRLKDKRLKYEINGEYLFIYYPTTDGLSEKKLAKCSFDSRQLKMERPQDVRMDDTYSFYAQNLVVELWDKTNNTVYQCSVRDGPKAISMSEVKDPNSLQNPDKEENHQALIEVLSKNGFNYPKNWSLISRPNPDFKTFFDIYERQVKLKKLKEKKAKKAKAVELLSEYIPQQKDEFNKSIEREPFYRREVSKIKDEHDKRRKIEQSKIRDETITRDRSLGDTNNKIEKNEKQLKSLKKEIKEIDKKIHKKEAEEKKLLRLLKKKKISEEEVQIVLKDEWGLDVLKFKPYVDEEE